MRLRGIALAFLFATSAFAAEGYLRQPVLNGDTLVFAAEGDLWTASVHGGLARRLTVHPGFESHPEAASSAQQIRPHASCRIGRLKMIPADVRAKTIFQDKRPASPPLAEAAAKERTGLTSPAGTPSHLPFPPPVDRTRSLRSTTPWHS